MLERPAIIVAIVNSSGSIAHADQIGAVDALEAFGHDRLDAGQAHALGRPVARGALAIVLAGNDDQRLLALHVGFDRIPHAHDLSVRLEPGQRTLLDLAVDHGHVVDQIAGWRRSPAARSDDHRGGSRRN
jgi:hypothetical protein